MRPTATVARAEARKALQRSFIFERLDSRQLRGFAAAATTQAGQRAVLLRAAEQLLSAEKRLGAKPKRQAELEQALADVARVRENARILGAVRVKQVDAMSEQVVQLEARIIQLRARLAELASEADGFAATAKRALRPSKSIGSAPYQKPPETENGLHASSACARPRRGRTGRLGPPKSVLSQPGSSELTATCPFKSPA